jgi:hypothetical protein
VTTLAEVVVHLRAERGRAHKRLQQIDAALAALNNLGSSDRPLRGRARSRKSISAAGKRRIAAAQRARWAKWKAARRRK